MKKKLLIPIISGSAALALTLALTLTRLSCLLGRCIRSDYLNSFRTRYDFLSTHICTRPWQCKLSRL